tara:strand:- start:345 stop:866 length:522 start_codon:yes stop_codon:yes gene_type:complete
MAIKYGDGSDSNAGRIIQAVAHTNPNHYAYSINSQSDATTSTTFASTISPASSSSKILVMMSFSISAPSDVEFSYGILRELNGSVSQIALGSGSGARREVTGAGELRVSSRLSTFNTSHIDAPNSTNQCKYFLKFRHDSSATRNLTFNYDTNNANSYGAFRTCSMINLLEIAS